MHLTDKYIASLKPDPSRSRVEVGDDQPRGLHLRVSRNGIKSFSLKLRVNGRQYRHTIGTYPAMTLADARKHATRMIAQISDGIDPSEEKRKRRERAQAPGRPTLDDVIKVYGDQVRGNSRYQHEKVQTLRRELEALLSREVESLTGRDLVAIVDRKVKTAPIAANRLVAALSVFCKWLAQREYTPSNLAEKLTMPAKERARDRVLTLEEVRAVWNAASQMHYPFGPMYQLLILTGQRREEVASMCWDEIDWREKLWAIPGERTKNGKPHLVPLPDHALTILSTVKDIPGIATAQGLVFTCTGDRAVSGFSRAKRRLDVLSGVNDWRVHDLRRTAVTHMAKAGVSPIVADKILNHVASSTLSTVARVYQHSDMIDERREALDIWANVLMGLD